MLNLTRQERQVLIALSFIFLCGALIDLAVKKSPDLKEVLRIVDGDGIYPKVDLNRATARELERLPMIGPATAGRIIAYREENGPFVDVGELRSIPGIGPANYQKLVRYFSLPKRGN